MLANLSIAAGQILDHLWPVNIFKRQIAQRPFSNLLSPLAWTILRIAVRDKLYFQNDDLAVILIDDRRILAETLWKLEGLAMAEPLKIPACTSHFFIVNPQGLQEKNWFLLTHPKIDIRVKRLIGYYPL
jgi:heat shock protein HtpX